MGLASPLPFIATASLVSCGTDSSSSILFCLRLKASLMMFVPRLMPTLAQVHMAKPRNILAVWFPLPPSLFELLSLFVCFSQK